MREIRILVAELAGTFILMLGGPGVAVLGATPGSFGDAGTLVVALGFGFALLVIVYTVGPISGAHVNPAVTFALAVLGRVPGRTVPSYLIGQIVGAVLGGLTIWVIAEQASAASPLGRSWTGVGDSNFATNLWTGEFMGFWPMVIAEVVLTAVLVLAVLSTTSAKHVTPGAVGLQLGAVLTLIHLISIPIDNTSVNPVRSFGMALFAGGESLEQLWAFLVFPTVGALLGAGLWSVLGDAPTSDDGPASSTRASVRAAAARATASIQDAVDE